MIAIRAVRSVEKPLESPRRIVNFVAMRSAQVLLLRS
jgi:hypothetical protein